jgi:hypothetical protein
VFTGGCSSRDIAYRKLVILAVDGMDLSLIEPLLEEGRLPNLAARIGRGGRGL